MSVRAIFRGDTQMGRPSGTSAPIRVDPDTNGLKIIAGGAGATAEYDALGLEATAGAVTQATNISTGVELNERRGAITTVTGPSIAAGAEAAFTLTNSYIALQSVVVVSVRTQFTDGVVVAFVKSQLAGSCVIGLTNVDAAAVSAGTAVINFAVL